MQRLIITTAFLCFYLVGFSQNREPAGKKEIQKTLTTFMDCIIKKDSLKFFSLFHNEPVVWIGVFKEKTQQERLKKDSSKKAYFTSTYQRFYRTISDLGSDEEKFYNINIDEDGSIASVTFDYSFWTDNKKTNWGKESWAMINVDGKWKITTVIFSLENEEINREPQR